jgi:hypothetical protein
MNKHNVKIICDGISNMPKDLAKEIILLTINPSMCSHSGPGLIGITCFK